MKRVGIHIRLDTSLEDMLAKAQRLHLPFFQCLLIHQHTRRLIQPSENEIERFRALVGQVPFKQLFLHASYYFNLCNPRKVVHEILMYELALAHQLGFSHVVLHPGTVVNDTSREESIKVLARALDYVIEHYPTFIFVLENTAACTAKAIGSDLYDFATLATYMRHYDKLRFCIDTAHAYAYGYDIGQEQGLQSFLTLIANTITFDRVALIHLNNTHKVCGSGIDQHAAWQTGLIPPAMLAAIMNYSFLKHTSIILELPILSEQQEREMLAVVSAYE